MPSDHFPNHPEAHDALLALGVNVNDSYRRWILELAPARAADLLALPATTEERSCVVCDAPVGYRKTTCSDRCRTRLWRTSSSP